MDTITLTLKHDTIQGIIYMIENRIDNLQYKELEMYRGQSMEKRINNYIEKWKNRLNELEAFMSKDNCEQEVKE
jgi:hypothetical protein